MRKTYSGSFKAKVVLEILKEEKTISEIASQYLIHPNMLTKWKKQAIASTRVDYGTVGTSQKKNHTNGFGVCEG